MYQFQFPFPEIYFLCFLKREVVIEYTHTKIHENIKKKIKTTQNITT